MTVYTGRVLMGRAGSLNLEVADDGHTTHQLNKQNKTRYPFCILSIYPIAMKPIQRVLLFKVCNFIILSTHLIPLLIYNYSLFIFSSGKSHMQSKTQHSSSLDGRKSSKNLPSLPSPLTKNPCRFVIVCLRKHQHAGIRHMRC
jgi:hypothetical protein